MFFKTEGTLTPAHVRTRTDERKMDASPGNWAVKLPPPAPSGCPRLAFSYQEILFLDLDKMCYYFK